MLEMQSPGSFQIYAFEYESNRAQIIAMWFKFEAKIKEARLKNQLKQSDSAMNANQNAKEL